MQRMDNTSDCCRKSGLPSNSYNVIGVTYEVCATRATTNYSSEIVISFINYIVSEMISFHSLTFC
jgi:hypothetical protein